MRILDKSLKLAHQLYIQTDQPFSLFSFIYDGNTLISIGKNNMRDESRKMAYFGKRFNVPHFKQYPYLHAEMDSISRLWGRIHISGREKMVIVRLTKDRATALAKPCNNCQSVISALGISRVWYSSESGWDKL